MTSARQLFLTHDEIRPNSISAAGINCDSHSAISDLAARSQKMSCAHQPQGRGRHTSGYGSWGVSGISPRKLSLTVYDISVLRLGNCVCCFDANNHLLRG